MSRFNGFGFALHTIWGLGDAMKRQGLFTLDRLRRRLCFALHDWAKQQTLLRFGGPGRLHSFFSQ